MTLHYLIKALCSDEFVLCKLLFPKLKRKNTKRKERKKNRKNKGVAPKK